ncbi:hypothetical protein RclHR1_00780023 [Rhizophagus clarus]|uniref:Protein kinase domain-containing protein n=1 Tax=Rhizophagus clarus TaxID=94130 RepID=A0A2Z6S4V4_9GLOM|nr:hypothetical protein RclHR1_00780023 [Rhizophagus clarus]
MAKNYKIKDLNYYISWLNYSISEEHIRYYEYSDFINIQQIGKGSYGNVVRVNWKNPSRLFALKSFNNNEETLKEVLKLHRSVDEHENIIRLYGITKMEDAINQTNKYSLVLEYANNGTLDTYLNEHFDKLDWSDKYRLALQLASAVEFLHEKNIIHRDLHASNILVHQDNIKLADFGLSKKIAEASSNASKILGVIPYVDPVSFNNQGRNYKLNKKSDVYSIGVLMWQISSGYMPFKGLDYNAPLILLIVNGKREEMIDGTPAEYNKLYTECWKYKSNERPNMPEVVSFLQKIISPEHNDTIDFNFNKKKEPEKYKSVSSLSKRTIDINNDLINVKSLNINDFEDSLSNASNNVGSSIDDKYYHTNHSLLKLEKKEFINNVYEKETLEKYRSTSKLRKLSKDINNYLTNDGSLNINELLESENSSSSVSNKEGPSIDETDYDRDDSERYEPTSKLSKRTIDINNALINDIELLNIDDYEYKSKIIMDSEYSPFGISNQATVPSTGDTYIYRNQLLLKLENEGFITPDEKVKELLKELTEPKFLYALKLLFENLQNKFSSQILISSLKSLANPTLFDYYSEENVARLELHLRNWIAVLERIQFSNSPIVLSKDLLNKVCNSLSKFAEIYYKTIQVIDRSNFNQQKDKRYNYNIDFLLIYLRDMLYSLYDDVTLFQKLLKRNKDFLKNILNITSSSKITISDENYSIESIIIQLRQGLNFKYSVASYYVDWRIMLIIQHNLFVWSESSEIISKKFAEMVLMEYIWRFLEREWNSLVDECILDSQARFEEVSNKVIKTLRNTGSFLSNLGENEHLALPHILWFGILDLAQNLIQKSNRTSTYGLCYYLAMESLNKAPNSFIQFKAIEILLHLHNIDNQMFSMIEGDFDQYIERLNKNNLTDLSEKFQNLLIFIKQKYFNDSQILNDSIRKGKGKVCLNQNIMCLKEKQILNSYNIIDVIADEITCPISSEPTNQLCILKCQHILSLYNLKKLKQKKCPVCREKLDNNDIRCLSQNTIYKNLYSQFFKAGRILPTIELEEDSKELTSNQYDSDSSNSEIDLILTKKNMKAIKLNSNIFSSIFPRISRKQHPIYQSIIKELNGKYYKKAESLCKKFLELFPKSYSVRCILAYIYRCFKNYEQAHLYLKEAIELKPKKSIAYFIRGEIFFWQNEYVKAIKCLNVSLLRKAKPINLHIILGNTFLKKFHYADALKNYNIVLSNDPNNYLCLKNCAYIFEKREDYINCLKILNKLLNISNKDSLILCYYGEILENLGKYDEALIYFTKANIIDPENVYNLNKRAVAYFVLQCYDEALLDLEKVIQLDSSNCLAYYNKGLIYYTIGNIEKAMVTFEKCAKLDPNDNLSKVQIYYMKYLQNKKICKNMENLASVITKIDKTLHHANNDKSVLLILCKMYIDLLNMKVENPENYFKKILQLLLLLPEHDDVSIFYSLRLFSGQYLNFWSDFFTNSCKYIEVDDDNNLTELGIVDPFSRFIYKVMIVYFISNITNLNNEYHQFQVNDTNSLSGRILSFESKAFSISLPKFYTLLCCIIWKINIKKILSKDCSIKFVIKQKIDSKSTREEHILKYDDLSKLEGLGWIEYSYKLTREKSLLKQPVIEVNGLNMQIDYIRFISDKYREEKQIYFPKMGHLLPIHKICPNVPEAFKDKYFSKKEMENFLEVKDIIDNL